MPYILLMEEILQVVYPLLQGFIHPTWLAGFLPSPIDPMVSDPPGFAEDPTTPGVFGGFFGG